MKKGIFSLLLMVIMINPVFSAANMSSKTIKGDITITSDNVPQGDIEDFYNRIKNACDNPETVPGNQLPPSNIMFACARHNIRYAAMNNFEEVDLPNGAVLDAWIFCDKGFGSKTERWVLDDVYIDQNTRAADEDLDVIGCPTFIGVGISEIRVVTGLTCDDIAGIPTVQQFCVKLLDEDSRVYDVAIGEPINLCDLEPGGPSIPEQPLPELPGELPEAPKCDGKSDGQPGYVPSTCCDGSGPIAPICSPYCDTYPKDDVPKWCCDGDIQPVPKLCGVGIGQLPAVVAPITSRL